MTVRELDPSSPSGAYLEAPEEDGPEGSPVGAALALVIFGVWTMAAMIIGAALYEGFFCG